MLAAGHGAVSWTGPSPQSQRQVTPLGETLRRICNASGYSAIDTFLDGAKLAYEEVSSAFAKGDLSGQRYLFSDDVFDTFAEALAQRATRGVSVELTFIRVGDPDIVAAELSGGYAWVSVRFISTVVSVTRDGGGKVLAGDPDRLMELAEVWTFARDLRDPEPKWLIIATELDE
jgi:predicted lipid-binding transport protein (Tim44 family)